MALATTATPGKSGPKNQGLGLNEGESVTLGRLRVLMGSVRGREA